MKSTITREPITHDLKIYPEFFSAVCTGVKRAELRKNDRDYRVGDTLHLMETPRGSCHRTGEFINVKITHIADVGEWMPDYVLLSVELQERRKADSEPVILYRQVNPVNGMKTYWAELDPEEFRHLKQHTDENAEFMTLYRHAQPTPVVPVVPDDVLDALQKVARIRLDMNDFDGDRRGIADCLCDAEEALIEVVNRRAAMLSVAPKSPGSEPATVPGKWIPVSERMPEEGGDMIVFTDGIVMSGISYAKKKGFYIQALEYDDDEPVDSVTHWMPLPDGPKEVKGEQPNP